MKRNQLSLEKWLILELRKEMYKMSMEYLVPERKGECKIKQNETQHNDGKLSKGHRS